VYFIFRYFISLYRSCHQVWFTTVILVKAHMNLRYDISTAIKKIGKKLIKHNENSWKNLSPYSTQSHKQDKIKLLSGSQSFSTGIHKSGKEVKFFISFPGFQANRNKKFWSEPIWDQTGILSQQGWNKDTYVYSTEEG
jgi:hypothetical protein